MDEYFDRLMEKIPGATVAEKKVWFPLFFFAFDPRKVPKK